MRYVCLACSRHSRWSLRRAPAAREAVAPDARGAPDDARPRPLPRRAGAEGDVSGRGAARGRLRAARPRSRRAPGPHRRVQHAAPRSRRRGSWRSTPAPTSSSGCSATSPATWWCSRAATAARSTGSSRRSSAGLNVLADKPWILRSADLPELEAALATADQNGVVAYDIMTERFEITTILQRTLVNDRRRLRAIASRARRDEPGVYMESVHYLMKVVAGAPNIRPAWFFDTRRAGRGPERHRHAPGGPGAVDAVPGPGDRLPAAT